MFNINGKTRIPTLCGGFVTIGIIFLLIVYAIIKLDMLLSKSNPNISSFMEE